MTSKHLTVLIGWAVAALAAVSLIGCGGSSVSSPPPQPIAVSVAPQLATVPAGGAARLTAVVSNDGNGKGVTWSVSCSIPQCGTVSAASGTSATYTAPSSVPASNGPTSITVTATSASDTSKSASATLIPVGHIAGYDVGVDYHAFGDSLDSSAFLNEYNQPNVRQTVQAQLQGLADRGATLMHTRVLAGE